MRHYYSRFAISLSLLLALLAAALPGHASGLELQPFKASYKALRNGQYVANAEFSLSNRNGVWIWRMDTRPRGLYRWLTRKKPWRETHMSQGKDGWHLSIETDGDYQEGPAKRAVWFDYDQQRAYFADAKNQRVIDFSESPDNYHSIHLQYLEMKAKGETERDLLFYRKGGIYQSTLSLSRGIKLKHDNGRDYVVDRVQQTFNDGKRNMIYDYHADSPAPLRIERRKGDTVGILWRSALQ